jgi:hypothetical protein
MKKRILCVVSLLVIALSCQQEDENLAGKKVSEAALSEISKLGFSIQNVKRVDDGYLVEGDIVLNFNDLKRGVNKTTLRIAENEQYRTTNLVAAPRVIRISVASNLGSKYVSATDDAIARYNAQSLMLTFQRVTTGGDIQIMKANFLEQTQFLASAGFPSNSGQPYNRVKVSTYFLDGQPAHTVTSVLAHEIGHCIGFRHTDFMDRSYSCGGPPANETAGSIGAINIPGTPSDPDAGSFMLSCINSGGDRPFNANDVVALDYLY